MGRRTRRRPPPLQRSTASVTTRPAIAVFCEGGTERAVLEAMRVHWRIAELRTSIVGGDPSHVVELARRTQRSYRPDELEVWVVFDRDEHPHWSSAIDRALQCRIRLAISNPCIELWGLLLHRDQTAHLSRDQAQRELKRLHKGYDHTRSPYLDPAIALQYLDDAERRARRLCERAHADGDPWRNPITTFSELVATLRERARD